MGWILLLTGLVALVGFAALQYALARNGPAVLDKVDRLTGGDRDVRLLERVSFGDNPAQKLAVYGAVKAEAGTEPAKPVIVFVHGGSWRSGDPDDYGFVARGLAPEGFVVVLGGYRLGEEGKFPAMLEDTAAAVAWVHANIARHGGDPDAIFLAGHSAGAYNVAMVALDRQWLGREGLADETLKGVVGLAGPYDFFPFDSDSTRAAFGNAPRPEETQPINHVRPDAPPMLLLTGGGDTVVKPRNTAALSTALREAGAMARDGYYPGMDHNRILLALASPWRRDRAVLDQVASFVRRPVNTGAAPPRAAVSVPVQAESR